jgi:hypothetical protein
MKIYDDIFVLGTLARIQRAFSQIRELSKRVAILEISQSWLKHGWTLVIAVWICVVRLALVKP